MYSESVLVMNDTGLHARPASEFTQTANLYESTITIQKKGVWQLFGFLCKLFVWGNFFNKKF